MISEGHREVDAARTLIVVPTFNELTNIAELVPQIFTQVNGIHVLVVDDNSPDGTADFVENMHGRFPQLRVLRRTEERGLGRAYTAGILYGLENGFEIVGTMDADLSHDPAYLPAMFDLLQDHDVVIGSSSVSGGGPVH